MLISDLNPGLPNFSTAWDRYVTCNRATFAAVRWWDSCTENWSGWGLVWSSKNTSHVSKQELQTHLRKIRWAITGKKS